MKISDEKIMLVSLKSVSYMSPRDFFLKKPSIFFRVFLPKLLVEFFLHKLMQENHAFLGNKNQSRKNEAIFFSEEPAVQNQIKNFFLS